MASVYKPKGRNIYRAEFKDQHGKTRTISTGTDDQRVAESLAQKIEEDADRVRVGMAPKHLEITGPYLRLVPLAGKAVRSWEEAQDKYLGELRRQARSATHPRDVGQILGKVRQWTGWQSLGEVSADRMSAYLRWLASEGWPRGKKEKPAGRSPRTQNHHLKKARAFLAWCVDQGWLSQNPLARVKLVRVGPGGRRHLRRALNTEELAQLHRQADQWAASDAHYGGQRALVYRVAAFSGFRRSELLRLLKEDCTPTGERPRWHVSGERTKNGQPARLPMTPECAAALREHWQALEPGAPLFASAPNMATWRADLERARKAWLEEVEGGAREERERTDFLRYHDGRSRVADFHALRYTFCALLARQYPIEVVSKLMRHSSIQLTSDVYLELGLDREGEGEWVLQPLLRGQGGDGGRGEITALPVALPLATPDKVLSA
jgi:integrase